MLSPLRVLGGRALCELKSEAISCCCVTVIPIRWRKLRNQPRAPSKFFIVREPTVIPPEDRDFLLKYYAVYKTQIKALAELFKEQYKSKGADSQVNIDHGKQEEEEHQRLLKENERWNREIAAAREVRIAMETLDHHRRAEEAIARRTQKGLDNLAKIEEEVLQTKEKVKTFVTMENLDQRIEEALANTRDYNFAIDKEGEKLHSDDETTILQTSEETDKETVGCTS